MIFASIRSFYTQNLTRLSLLRAYVLWHYIMLGHTYDIDMCSVYSPELRRPHKIYMNWCQLRSGNLVEINKFIATLNRLHELWNFVCDVFLMIIF